MDYILPIIILICFLAIAYGFYISKVNRSKFLEMKIKSEELSRQIAEESAREAINHMSLHDLTSARNDKRDPTK